MDDLTVPHRSLPSPGRPLDSVGRETDMLVCTGGPGSCLLGSADRKTTTGYFPSDAVRQRSKPNGVVGDAGVQRRRAAGPDEAKQGVSYRR